MSKIERIRAREILDSRGNPTVEVDVETKGGGFGRASAPSGASTGKSEALELRDGDDRYSGKGVRRAVASVTETISSELVGKDCRDQRGIDQILIDLDGTDDRSNLGANAMLATSLAVAKSAAGELGLELYRYLGGAGAHLLPVPMMNVINGGAHADNNLSVQEFMIVPLGAASFSEALRMGAEVYHELRRVLAERNLSTGLGDEGGFAPDLQDEEDALAILADAVERSGYDLGNEIAFALDPAASEFHKQGTYDFGGSAKSHEEMVGVYSGWIDRYPIVSIEDPLGEDDWEGWQSMTSSLGRRVQLVGDDVFVTKSAKLRDGIERGVANAILIKVNQVGTLTEAQECLEVAERAGYKTVVSHRSGETEDPVIADLAVAWGAGQIKTGAPARSDRVSKYNQLLRIEEQLGSIARYAGPIAFPRWHEGSG